MTKALVSRNNILRVKCLRFHQHGDPRKVLQLDVIDMRIDLQPCEVLIRYEAATILPAHLNIIENTYHVKATPPAIPGNEAVGIVEKIGRNVSKVSVGDRVIPLNSHGAWTKFEVQKESDVFRIDKSIDLFTAVSFLSNPITAWKMLTQYVELHKGDHVIQNLANSHCGQAVIQIAKVLGLKTINIVRDRPDIDALKSQLTKLGANYVFTENEFSKESRVFIKELRAKPKLALNGAGGRSALVLAGTLEYGGMSRRPHQIPTGALVFRDVKVLGVPAGYYLLPENQKERVQILEILHKLAVKKQLRGPCMQTVPLEQFSEAIDRTMQGRNLKQLLLMRNTNASKL